MQAKNEPILKESSSVHRVHAFPESIPTGDNRFVSKITNLPNIWHPIRDVFKQCNMFTNPSILRCSIKCKLLSQQPVVRSDVSITTQMDNVAMFARST